MGHLAPEFSGGPRLSPSRSLHGPCHWFEFGWRINRRELARLDGGRQTWTKNLSQLALPAMNCPCQSGQNLDQCCGPFIAGEAFPETAEQLMRSRYTAYTQANLGYIKKT